jgi:hypothetical protein
MTTGDVRRAAYTLGMRAFAVAVIVAVVSATPVWAGGACFAGQCDWRLPTRDELQTILADPFTGSECSTPSCIDATFGPTPGGEYWSATTHAGNPGYAWQVDFFRERVQTNTEASEWYVRAVRGGS